VAENYSASTTAEDVLAKMREQGITDLDDIVRKGLDVAQEAADKSDAPTFGAVFIHKSFCFYHEE
jgi:hypothetical protein